MAFHSARSMHWVDPMARKGARRRRRYPPATVGLTIGILAFPVKANALGPVDVEIGAKAGTATGTLGPLGFGIGGRGGVSVSGLYAGIDVVDYLGATSTCGGCSMPAGAQPVKQSRSALRYGFEVGYSFKLPAVQTRPYRVTIRPQLGLGDVRLSSTYGDPAPGNVADLSNDFYLEPGVLGLVSLGVFFVGADIGGLLLLESNGGGLEFTAHGQIGVTF